MHCQVYYRLRYYFVPGYTNVLLSHFDVFCVLSQTKSLSLAPEGNFLASYCGRTQQHDEEGSSSSLSSDGSSREMARAPPQALQVKNYMACPGIG